MGSVRFTIKLLMVSTVSYVLISWTWTLKSSRLKDVVYDGHDSLSIVDGFDSTAGYNKIIKYCVQFGLVEPSKDYVEGHLMYFVVNALNSSALYDTKIYKHFIPPSSWHASVKVGAPRLTSTWDPVNKRAYIVGRFSTSTGKKEQIIQYDARKGETKYLWQHIPGRIGDSVALWDTRRERGYLIGFEKIYQFEPASSTNDGWNSFSMLAKFGKHEYEISNHSHCAVYSNISDSVYIITKESLLKFDPSTNFVKHVQVRAGFWRDHDLHRISACVFIPKLNRIYVLSGRRSEEISFIDLGADSVEEGSASANLSVPKPILSTHHN